MTLTNLLDDSVPNVHSQWVLSSSSLPDLSAELTLLLTLYSPGFPGTQTLASLTQPLALGILLWPGLPTDSVYARGVNRCLITRDFEACDSSPDPPPLSSFRPAAFWMPSPGCPGAATHRPAQTRTLSLPGWLLLLFTAPFSRSPQQNTDSV